MLQKLFKNHCKKSKGVVKSYFADYSYVVIIFFKTGLHKSSLEN